MKLSLKGARIESGLSQTEIGEKMGVSKSTVSRWENGLAFPSKEQIGHWCEICKIKESNLRIK